MARKAFFVTGFSAVSLGSIFYHYNFNRDAKPSSDSLWLKSVSVFAATPTFDKRSPSKLWNDNWDFRDPKIILKKSRPDLNECSPEFSEELKQRTPTASRNIFLIRHGQYIYGNSDTECCLTKLGHEQAHLTGERLQELGITFDKVVISTMTRAKETGEDILSHLPSATNVRSCDMIREGVPIAPEPPVPHYNPSEKDQFVDSARIEAAFRKYLHRASPSQKADSNELFICHGNVIRYFICRALQFPPDGWLRFSVEHASITMLTIRPNGRVFVRCVGCSGHMAPDKISVM